MYESGLNDRCTSNISVYWRTFKITKASITLYEMVKRCDAIIIPHNYPKTGFIRCKQVPYSVLKTSKKIEEHLISDKRETICLSNYNERSCFRRASVANPEFELSMLEASLTYDSSLPGGSRSRPASNRNSTRRRSRLERKKSLGKSLVCAYTIWNYQNFLYVIHFLFRS